MFWLWLICLIGSITSIIISYKKKNKRMLPATIVLLVFTIIFGITVIIPGLMIAFGNWQF